MRSCGCNYAVNETQKFQLGVVKTEKITPSILTRHEFGSYRLSVNLELYPKELNRCRLNVGHLDLPIISVMDGKSIQLMLKTTIVALFQQCCVLR